MKIELDEVMDVLQKGFENYIGDPEGYQHYMAGFLDGWKNWKTTEIKEEKDDDEQTFFEPLSGRFFKSTKAKIMHGALEMHRYMIDDINLMGCPNDWFDILGLEPTLLGNKVAWSVDSGFDVYFTIQEDDKCEEPYYIIGYKEMPKIIEV